MSCLCPVRRFLATFLVFLGLSAAHAQIIGSLPFQLTNGTVADAAQVMANYNYIIGQVNANAANVGANSSITSLAGLTTPLSYGQGGSQYYSAGVSTGTPNAQAVASGVVPSGFTLTAGTIVEFIAGSTNTGAMTLAYNGTSATNVLKRSASGLIPLTGGEVASGNPIIAFYDGAQFDLITNFDFVQFGKVYSLTSATTTDLGTSRAHIIGITGATAITSFGSSAQLDYPLYLLTFSGSLTLTYNASSLILPGSASIVTQPGDFAWVLYLGSGNWQVLSYNAVATPPAALGITLPGALGFSQTNNAGTPNSKVDLVASRVIVTNVTGNGIQFNSPPTCTINFTVNGIGGLDVGSLAASTWYYTFYASNGVTLGCFGSLSPVSPTVPSGYTFYFRAGAINTDGSSNFYRIKQFGNKATYIITGGTNTATFPFVVSGTTSGVTTAEIVQGNGHAVPSTATHATGYFGTQLGNATAWLAPNATYGAVIANPIAIGESGSSSNVGVAQKFDFLLESANVYYNSDSTGGLAEFGGWEDSVNAF